MKVLGFESSCDETGVALVETRPQGPPRLLAEALHSQVALHAAYGGVVPELASRDHIRRVLPLARQVLADAGCTLVEVDLVAYTRGPGLAGALLVGAGVAVALAAALGKPALGVHHLEGHLLSPFLGEEAPTFPFVALLDRIGFGFRRLVFDAEGRKMLASTGELRSAIDVGESEGVVAEDQAEMLHKVLEFTNTPVAKVMVPRTEIAWVEEGTTLANFLAIYADTPRGAVCPLGPPPGPFASRYRCCT